MRIATCSAPLRRIAVLAHLFGGAGRFRAIAAGRGWAIVLICRDRNMPAVPAAERISLTEAIRQADGPDAGAVAGTAPTQPTRKD
ncbi:hypothetical protein [Rhizomonospora bruguierae]|uniref:hypothetical protein n=1 Tax=Rhizomonospora bruguierae TaxID=1581705 RepID=UPI001BCC60F5|nr:hypothetical protein [Micromonospora sp. NBRC 107566]